MTQPDPHGGPKARGFLRVLGFFTAPARAAWSGGPAARAWPRRGRPLQNAVSLVFNWWLYQLVAGIALPLWFRLPFQVMFGMDLARVAGRIALNAWDLGARILGAAPPDFEKMSRARLRLERFCQSRDVRWIGVEPAPPKPRLPLARRPVVRLLAGLGMLGLWINNIQGGALRPAPSDAAPFSVLEGQSEHSRYVAGLNETFNRLSAGQKILFLDRDVVSLDSGLSGVGGYATTSWGDSVDRLAAERTGLPLGGMIAGQLAGGLRDGEAASADLAVYAPGEACVIMPEAPDHVLKDRVAEFIGLSSLAYPDHLTARDLGIDFDWDTWRRYVDYHEGSHCLDKHFKDAGLNEDDADTGFEDYWHRHRGEVFADIHAALMLAAEGRPEMAARMADIRTLSAAKAAPLNAAFAFGWGKWGGAVYFNGPALKAAAAEIQRRGVDGLKSLGPKGIAALASELATANALDRARFAELHEFHLQLMKAGFAAFDDFLFRPLDQLGLDPAYHPPEWIRGFEAEGQQALRRLFGDRLAVPPEAAPETPPSLLGALGGFVRAVRADWAYQDQVAAAEDQRIGRMIRKSGGDPVALAKLMAAERDLLRARVTAADGLDQRPALLALAHLEDEIDNADRLLDRFNGQPPRTDPNTKIPPPPLPAPLRPVAVALDRRLKGQRRPKPKLVV